MRLFACLITMFLVQIAFPQNDHGPTLTDQVREATAAYQRKDYKAFLERSQDAARLAPGSYSNIYRLARAYALNGDHTQALKLLERVVGFGAGLDAVTNPDFASLRALNGFKIIENRIEIARHQVNNSSIAFSVPEKDLLAESVAFDPRERAFYLGSTRKGKVVKIDRAGNTRDFLTERQDGLWSVIGVKVDSPRRLLWVNSTVTSNMPGFRQEDLGLAGVFKFDLKTGKLVKKYLVDNRSGRHFFNDLVLSSRGDVYLTDMFGQAVYTIKRGKDELELFTRSNRLTDPNGIALSEDENSLFVASREGITVIKVETGSSSPLIHDDDVTLSGIDGLYFYRNSLIAVQNGVNRVVRYHLNSRSDRVQRFEIIEANHPMFMNPTTGVLVADTFYFIANSQFGSFDSTGTLFPFDRLFETVILRSKL